MKSLQVLNNLKNLSVIYKEQGKRLNQVFVEWEGDHFQVDDLLVIGIDI